MELCRFHHWCQKEMFIFCVTIIFSINVCPVCAVVNFWINPTRYDLDGSNPDTSLSFDCSPANDFQLTFQTVIGKRRGQTDETIISMENVGPEFVWGTTNLQQRIPSPQIDKTAMRFRFNLQHPTCQDATYTYYCTVTGNTATAAGVVQQHDVNITAQTRPTELSLRASPQTEEGYDIGQYVIFTCRGLIGNAFENSNQYDQIFQWETRYVGSSFSSWQEFRPTENITVSGVPTQEANCQYRYSSVLHYTVTSLDIDRQFRCKVSSDEFSANYTITVKGTTTNRPGPVINPAVHAVLNFRISPSTYDISGNNPTTSLSFDCSPRSGFDSMFLIVIGRRRGQTEQTIISQIGNDDFNWGTAGLQQRIPNPIVDKTAKTIRFNLQTPTCQDGEYTYYCRVTGTDASHNPVLQSLDVNITAQSIITPVRQISISGVCTLNNNFIIINLSVGGPGGSATPTELSLRPSPDREGGYDIGEYVIFTCRGLIGNAFENSNQYDQIFQWETRYVGTSASSWQPFRPTSNIAVSGVPTQEANCQYRYESVLHYTVTSTDVYRQFRCKVSSDEYSANYTITVKESTSSSTTVQREPTSSSSTGAIVGGVIGCIVAIGIVVIIVVLVLRQSRRNAGSDSNGSRSQSQGNEAVMYEEIGDQTDSPTYGGLHTYQNTTDIDNQAYDSLQQRPTIEYTSLELHPNENTKDKGPTYTNST